MHLYCHFSLRSQMAPQQTAKFQTASFCHFRSTLTKDSVANYGSLWTRFPLCVKRTGCSLQCIKRFVLPLVGGATRFANLRRKFSKTQKSAADLCQIPRMVTVEIVINSTPVMSIRVTISCLCLRGDAFVSSFLSFYSFYSL